jgi:hypothetical protein
MKTNRINNKTKNEFELDEDSERGSRDLGSKMSDSKRLDGVSILKAY